MLRMGVHWRGAETNQADNIKTKQKSNSQRPGQEIWPVFIDTLIQIFLLNLGLCLAIHWRRSYAPMLKFDFIALISLNQAYYTWSVDYGLKRMYYWIHNTGQSACWALHYCYLAEFSLIRSLYFYTTCQEVATVKD